MKSSGIAIRRVFLGAIAVGVLACGQALEQRAERPQVMPASSEAEGPPAPTVAVESTPPAPSTSATPASRPSLAQAVDQAPSAAKNAWDASARRMMMQRESFDAAGVAQMHSLHAAPPLDFNTEQYASIQEEGFVSVADRPLSTFSIDVDTASYANVRRFLQRRARCRRRTRCGSRSWSTTSRYDYPQPQRRRIRSPSTSRSAAARGSPSTGWCASA